MERSHKTEEDAERERARDTEEDRCLADRDRGLKSWAAVCKARSWVNPSKQKFGRAAVCELIWFGAIRPRALGRGDLYTHTCTHTNTVQILIQSSLFFFFFKEAVHLKYKDIFPLDPKAVYPSKQFPWFGKVSGLSAFTAWWESHHWPTWLSLCYIYIPGRSDASQQAVPPRQKKLNSLNALDAYLASMWTVNQKDFSQIKGILSM